VGLGPLPCAVYDLTVARIWGILQELAASGLITLATRATTARRARPDPVLGQERARVQKQANRVHARLRSLGERANAKLKNRRILRKLRCCP
jgi:hypothetical protein